MLLNILAGWETRTIERSKTYAQHIFIGRQTVIIAEPHPSVKKGLPPIATTIFIIEALDFKQQGF